MTKQTINVGTSPNDNRGDSLRISFQKINANFTELYNATGGGLDLLNIASHIIPSATNTYDLGSPTRQWRSLYVSNNTIYLGGTALSIDGSGNLTVGGSRVGATSYTDLTGKPALSTVATTGSYTDLTNRPALFSGSYADLTNKPNLAGTYQFSVAADDSTQRVISTDEVIKFIGAGGITTSSDSEGKITITQGTTSSLVNGSKTVSLGTDGNLTFADAGETFFGNGYLQSGTEGTNIGIKSWDGRQKVFVNETNVTVQTVNNSSQAYNWTFGTTGALTLPGDIKSNGNINIDINLADSTLRRWQFGEDGNLAVPGDINLSGGTISQYSQNGLTGLKLVANADQGQNVTIMGTGNNTFPILNYVGTTLSGITIGTPEGDWNFMNGNLTIPGDIRSEGNINIEINLSDSTLRRWSFGEDGSLTLPSVGKINNGAYDWTFGSTGITTFPGVINAGNINNLVVNDLGGGTSLTAGSQVQIGNSAGIAGAGVIIKNAVTNTLGGETSLEAGSKIQMDNGNVSLFSYTYTGIGGDSGLEGRLGVEVDNSYLNNVVRIGTRTITTNGGDTITSFQGVTFSRYGELTFPDNTVQTTAWTGIANALRSEGNINIEINLADSTLRRWQFGEDGNLNLAGPVILPNNSELRPSTTAYDTALAGWEFIRGGEITDRITNNLATALGWPMVNWYPTGATAQGYIDFLLNARTLQNTFGATLIIQPAMSTTFYNEMRAALIAIRDSYNTSTTAVSLSSAYGKSWNFGSDGALTIPGDIKSNGNINIDINLSDSTLRRWSFGEDGILTLPSVGKISNGAYDWTFGSNGNTTFPTGLVLGAPRGPNTVNFTTAIDKSFQIETGNSTTSKLWQFGTDGSLTIPGDIKSNGNINIDINLIDSTLRRWSFGEDGILTLPSVGKISNGAYDWTFGTDGKLTAPGNLEVDGGRVILHPYGNAYIESVDYGVNSADSAVNIFGGPYQKIKLRAGFGTEAAWTFGTNGKLTLSTAGIVRSGTDTAQVGYQAVFTQDIYGNTTTGAISGMTFVNVGSNAQLLALIDPSSAFGNAQYNLLSPITITYSDATTQTFTEIRSTNIVSGSYIAFGYNATTAGHNFPITVTSANYAAATTAPEWTFGTDGKLTVPGDIESTTSLDITTNHIPYYSNEFNGGQYISIANSSALQLGNATSWTIEAWVYITAYPVSGTMTIIEKDAQIAVSYSTYLLNIASDGKAAIYTGYGGGGDNNPTGKNVVSSTNLPLNQWVHLAAVWNGSNITLYQNGVSVGTVSAATTPITGEGGRAVNIGREDYLKYFTGKISNVRIVKNTAVYTGAFTPSTSPLTSIANTSLLTCNAATINVGTGTATVINESPFGVYGDKTWAFGTDGSLTLPIGVSIDSSVSALYPKIIADSGKLFSIQGQGSTGSAAMAWSLNPNTDTQYAAVGVTRGGGDDLAKVVLTAGNTTATLKVWKLDQTGAFTFPDATVQTTAWTGTTTGAITAGSFNTDQITVVGNRLSTTLTNANLELECNGTGGVVINTLADATTASTVKSVGYLGLPQSATATTATLAIGDAGKHIYLTTTGQTITIPAASSVAYPIGTTITFIAGPSATTTTIAINTDTLRLAGGTSTGSRTLAANGMATAVKVSGTSSAGVWYINGIGLT